MKQSAARFTLLAAVVFAATCSKSPSTPTTPSTPNPSTSARAAVSLTLSSVTGQRTSSGYSYGVQTRAQESAGVASTVTSVTVAVLDGNSNALVSLNRMSDLSSPQLGGSASATFSSTIADDVAGHGYASRVQVTVVYSDATGAQTTTASSAIPALPAGPSTFSVCGTVKDGGSPVSDVQVTIVGSSRSATTDAQGKYCFADVSTGTITLQIIRSGYNTLQQAVNVTGNMTVDLTLVRPAAPNVSIDQFTVDSSVITKGQSTTLRWSVSNSTSVSIDNSIGTVSSSGTRSISPTALSTTYRLTASGTGGPISRTLSVTAADPSAMTCTVPTPSGVTAICKDGTYSQSQNNSGTCSSHGGVQCWVCPGPLCQQ